MSALLHNLIHFSRLLGDLGLDVQAVRTLDIVRALDHVNIGERPDFYHTLRCLLVRRPQDIPLFDEAFRVFWRKPPNNWTTRDLRAMGEHRRTGAPKVEMPARSPNGESTPSNSLPIKFERVATQSYSNREVLRQKDFADLTTEELSEARRMLAELRWDMEFRRTRRWRPGPSAVPDLRRVMRSNLQHGGEPVTLPTRRQRDRRRPLVLLCDVSGSMERYSRMLVHFLYCMTGRLQNIEVFVFATRLTRVTRELAPRLGRTRDSDIVSRLLTHVPDFAGGTRIGDVLREFNIRWSRRVLGHGAIVLVISDGWDRGEPDQLRREMERLQRTARRLVWLNPLLGSPEYVPLTRGIKAALPFIDDFLPVHNLESLAQLGEHLNTLPGRRRQVKPPAFF